ncbi:MAG: 3D-(3,5/4)-trihydroxycyclohexane-1,2-dione acylhydrolase (decyclizing), partial [Deltaproteobacteria bacterium]|nr:3D-(3,5/4)-trihydroxycyclohexane-1,2-dione acylhydrolase (decyclizing) [Deltaproteobacteria bacterium]
MKTVRLTTAQALIRYLAHQHVERDGATRPFFGGVAGIFGHGNLAGIGQALQQEPGLRYLLVRNEQAAVHAAVAFARQKDRLGALACTSSVGPGATNMVTGAALATINRLPVLLLPGDVFARRNVGPVLQQLEHEASQDVSVNDCFKPVSRYWDRVNRPDQLPWALPQAMRVLTSPAATGAVTLALPQDVQAEAWDFPAGLFEDRTWHVARQRPDRDALARAASMIRASRRPVIVAGGGVTYSGANEALAALARATGIPVVATQAGNGALSFDHPEWAGAVGATGNLAANALAAAADVVIGIGTRWSDFTTASQTVFRNPLAEFVCLNVCEADAFKQGGCALLADARAGLEDLSCALEGWRIADAYAAEVARLRSAWASERERVTAPRAGAALPSQAEVIGALDAFARPTDVIVNAAGSAPGDLHKLWRPRDPKQYHVEYGYSCMGYEVPGGIGVKLAAPEREVHVLSGDGSWLMMSSDLATAVQEGIKLTVVLVDNHGFASIGALSGSLGSGGFGT